MIFCCVFSLVLPFWTYCLVSTKSILHYAASNERTLSSMSKSGDIYGICEIIEFAGIIHNKQIDIDFNNELREYLEKCVETYEFKKAVFILSNFLEQYQIVKYVNDNYDVKITFKSHSIKNALRKQINSKEFSYQFKNNNPLLNSYVNNCFESANTKLFWEYAINGTYVEWVYPLYLENLCDASMGSLHDMIAARDINNTSNELLLTLIDMIEKKPDNSEKSNLIRRLCFTQNISPEQCNALAENNFSNHAIEKYFSYQYEPVKFLSYF